MKFIYIYIFISSLGLLGQPMSVGSQFQINSYEPNIQTDADVAKASTGQFVVVWESVGSSGTDSSGLSVQAQRYNASGMALGGEFQVNTTTLASQRDAAVDVDESGNFVVVWTDYNASGLGHGQTFGQRYNASGTALGGETLLADFSEEPDVSVAPTGNFVLVWNRYGSIFGARFAADATAAGTEFQINTFDLNSQSEPKVAIFPSGNFVTVWQSQGSLGTDNDGSSIQAQIFDSSASMVGSQIQVNTNITGFQQGPSVAVLPSGDFVVVWTDSNVNDVQGQRLNGSGAFLGSEFSVASDTSGIQGSPVVAADANDNFLVGWVDSGIEARAFLGDGTPVGNDFQVNTLSGGNQPALAIDGNGDVIVVWNVIGGAGTDMSSHTIQGQLFGGPVPVNLQHFAVE